MDPLQLLYERLAALRAGGVKMKDIAAWVGLDPSILSSLYTTVLPAYLDRRRGNDDEEALRIALARINNISLRRLQALLPGMNAALETFEMPGEREAPENPFLVRMRRATIDSATRAKDILGTYISYSLSSEEALLKQEPFRLAAAREGFTAERLSVHGDLQPGFAMIGDPQNLYVFIDEKSDGEVMPVTLYIQIPLFHRPRQLRGLYIGMDYNRNPIARRVVLCRQEDCDDTCPLAALPHGLLKPEELDDALRPYYEYAAGRENMLRMCTVPSLRMDASDLQREKQMLDL